jgi:hypothetical protein
MADIADMADITQQQILDAHISNSRGGYIKMEGDGLCLSCGYETELTMINGLMQYPRWCCIECRDVWASEQ